MNNIEEIVYSAPVDYNDLLQSAKYVTLTNVKKNNFHSFYSWMTDKQLELLLPSLLQGRPNTYTFTKALAENLLQNEAKDLPVAIIRPSIVGAACKEPLPVSLIRDEKNPHASLQELMSTMKEHQTHHTCAKC